MIFPAQTSRLVLRAWREDDFDAFAAMNADPRVMEYFPAPLTREESATFFGHIRAEFQTEGFGLYAVERISDGLLLGYTGLHRVTFDGLCGQIEIGWRLRADAWGTGYAPEAAQACLLSPPSPTCARSGSCRKSAWSAWVSSTTQPCRRGTPCGGMCSTGQGSKDRFRQRASPAVHAAADIAGPRKPGNDNPRKPSSLRGLLLFRAQGRSRLKGGAHRWQRP